jgi:hypothetical protein
MVQGRAEFKVEITEAVTTGRGDEATCTPMGRHDKFQVNFLGANQGRCGRVSWGGICLFFAFERPVNGPTLCSMVRSKA